MKVLFINSVCGIGSTGKICGALAEEYVAQGHEAVIAYGRDGNVPERYRKFAHRIGGDLGVKVSALRTRVLDDHGFANEAATKRFLQWAESYDPDFLWLHNIHGYYIHVGMLFEWIKSRPGMQVRWTLHDCWSFTGHCAHFTYSKCDRWKTGCFRCPEKKNYPASSCLDNSRANYARKKAAFTGVKNLTIEVPSRWLKELVQQSFLGEYPVEVRYTTIDTATFRPTAGDFRQKHGLEGKKVILGVAGVWTERKGLGDFLKLREILDEEHAIVLVGLDEQQLSDLPNDILGISRTANPRELAEIYSAADVFFNPTYEDNLPTVNLEAESCGTRVITYNTGGCAETVHRENSRVIPVGAYEQLPGLLEDALRD
jgi:glycosyltransferase involved in cell wall biosynthesis